MDYNFDNPITQELAQVLIRFKRLGLQKSTATHTGIRQSEYMLLMVLAHSDEYKAKGAKVTDLGAKLAITPAAVTHMLDALVEKKYVERLADPADRRIVLIKPTAKGLSTVNSFVMHIMERCEGLVAYLGEKDSRELIRLLNLSLDYVNEHKK